MSMARPPPTSGPSSMRTCGRARSAGIRPRCRRRCATRFATKLCRPCAPDALRTRCRAAARARDAGRSAFPDPPLASLSIAAALCLVMGGVLMYGLTGLSPTVLAAQLTLDHLDVFCRRHVRRRAVDARASEERYARDYGSRCSLPRLSIAGLQLVGLRRCYCGEGAAAHAMYRLNGRPVSLYVIPDASRDRARGRRVRPRRGHLVERGISPTCSSARSRGRRSKRWRWTWQRAAMDKTTNE